MPLKAILKDAKDAYHDLMTGRSTVEFVDQNGERVRYQPANAFRLAAYIQDLEHKIAGGGASGPMRIWGK